MRAGRCFAVECLITYCGEAWEVSAADGARPADLITRGCRRCDGPVAVGEIATRIPVQRQRKAVVKK